MPMMRRYGSRLLVTGWTVAVWAAMDMGVTALGPQAAATPAAASHRAFVDRYCIACHNQRLKTAGLVLESLDLSNVPAQGEIWEKVVKKLRASMMPPPGRPHPDKATADAFV